jgi:hypothetical protein
LLGLAPRHARYLVTRGHQTRHQLSTNRSGSTCTNTLIIDSFIQGIHYTPTQGQQPSL